MLLLLAMVWAGCEKAEYAGGQISRFLPIYDLRNMHKGSDIVLTKENMLGSTSLEGIVISDHSGKNLPEGVLFVEQYRRLGLVRGMAIPIGPDASKYMPGDSIQVNIEGGVLKRLDGLLQLTGIQPSTIQKVASERPLPTNRVPSNRINENPNDYESTLVAIVKAVFDTDPGPGAVYSGDKLINDGFDVLKLHTEPTASFANQGNLFQNGVYYGIVINRQDAAGKLQPEHRLRKLTDARQLSPTPAVAIVISGYMADLEGGDGNREYMQFLATKDINFAVTPFSVVVTNNAGASLPVGFPTLGWATGSLASTGSSRTYKFNLTSGTVSKGEYFYVGGSEKVINGPNSTSIASAKWIRAFNYSTTDGDGFGLKTSGLFANSGNASGFAVFEGTTIAANTAPIDVVFIGSGGSLYNAAAQQGYRIANNDFYDKINPITEEHQPFYRSGENTMSHNYQTPSDQGFWNMLGGVYDERIGKWVKARIQSNLNLDKQSTLRSIEGNWLQNTIDGNGNVLRTDTIMPTKLKSQL